MQIHDTVPQFALQDERGEVIRPADYQGRPVALFFYPRADTPGCTVEACSFRDSYSKLQSAGIVVLGVSRDNAKDQKKFKDKFELPYPLLADVDETVCKSFGVLKEKNMYGKKVMGIERTTFLIDREGRIAKIFEKVKPEGHADEVLAAARELGLAA